MNSYLAEKRFSQNSNRLFGLVSEIHETLVININLPAVNALLLW